MLYGINVMTNISGYICCASKHRMFCGWLFSEIKKKKKKKKKKEIHLFSSL